MRIINKYEDGTKTKRVNYKKWYAQEKQKKGDKVRPLNEDVLTQFDDSLIARGFGEAQRRAMNATSHQEMGRKGAASRGIGGNGIMGLSEKRMPLKYLNDTGAQIHYIINDILNMNGDNWTDGGAGGPYIKNAKEGYKKFFEATDPYEAAVILNKCYIRPAAQSDWYERARIAKDMDAFLYKKGNKIHIKKKNRGKFTASAKAHGMSVQQYASHVLNDPNASPTQKKRANFARNAAKWKH